MRRQSLAVLAAPLFALTAGCSSSAESAPIVPGTGLGPVCTTSEAAPPAAAESAPPTRFTIVPDDYHVPYAGIAGDGRRFFLSDELFSDRPDSNGYVGVFLWNADGTFSEVCVDPVKKAGDLPPGQAARAEAEKLVQKRLGELGSYCLGPIVVEPFTDEVDGVTFGWQVTTFEGTYSINVEPGDFIAYYAPWDGLDYDT